MRNYHTFYILLLILSFPCAAQDNVYPAKAQSGTIIIKNGNVHTGLGQVISNGNVVMQNGKISSVTQSAVDETGATVLDAKGKNVYPGLILSVTDLGINEIGNGVRGSNDYLELGTYNPTVRSIVAYNTDSKIINTLRSNGILLACVAPQGQLLAGSSSVVQLDAWTWQDAIYEADNALHLSMPMLMALPRRFTRSTEPTEDPVKAGIKTIENVEGFFKECICCV